MANTTLTADIITKEAVMILDNELVAAKKVFRGYEEDFTQSQNGYEPGDTVSFRVPTDFTVREGETMSTQDVVEGKRTVRVDKMRGIDFKFSSTDLTLSIKKLSERVIKPAMVQLANNIDMDVMELYKDIPSWVGTPGNKVESYASYARPIERMDEMANPTADRCSILSPSDHWGLLGSQTSLYIQDAAKGAYRNGHLGKIGGVDTNMAQNVPTHVVGVAAGTPLVKGASQNVAYETVKDTGQQTLSTDGWDASTNGILNKGDVFTIEGVFAVNPVTKATLPFLRQFVVKSNADSDGAGNAELTISPAIVSEGAFKTVSASPADNAVITVMGTGGQGYRQNITFNKKAFALTSVPLVAPPGAVQVSRQTYKGLSVRLIPVYDGGNDVSKWRLDVLFGTTTIDPRLAHRFSG
ncbi:P22 phage major capsid protein family protein [Curvivirga aplysinae]|uniref:P22 phage major capsid protein family protein n=1 Tax=Curvivirga aplysinae TaxID=2529852 RepID=UPI0012BBCE75|nr:P22 phage major capsid protein family protein [Curvivirga aplysinae]MTI10195.1 hypothetical protein [Curvivirga aplysinae]